ncbi:MAG: hypothetical protein ACO395_09220 [Pontimonas sp.]
MPGLLFIIKYESPSHLYPVNVCESCASAAHDFSRCIIPREAYANATACCPICGRCSNLIVYLRTIYNPDLLVDIHELKNLFAYGRMEFTLVNLFKALDEGKIRILPGSGMRASAYLRKWREDNPDVDLPDDLFRQLALIREDPDLRSGSAVDHRIGKLKDHMMRRARDRARNSIQSSPAGHGSAYDEVNKLYTLEVLTGIRCKDRDGCITDSKFRNL